MQAFNLLVDDFIADCARENGFEYEASPVQASETGSYSVARTLPTLATEAEQAAFSDLMFGPEGCVEEAGKRAAAELGIDSGEPLSLAEEEQQAREAEEANERTLADARVIEAEAAWRRCMSEEGYDLESPDQAASAEAEIVLSEDESDAIEASVGLLREARLKCDDGYYSIYQTVFEDLNAHRHGDLVHTHDE